MLWTSKRPSNKAPFAGDDDHHEDKETERVLLFNFNNIRFHFRYQTMRDPYESRTVEVRESRVPGAGEGLFAVRDIGVGENVAYFAGVRLSATETSPRSDFSILLGKENYPLVDV